VFAQTKLAHLVIGDFEAIIIALGDQMAFDGESGGGSGFTQGLEDLRVGFQRDASAVFADLAEETMLDGRIG